MRKKVPYAILCVIITFTSFVPIQASLILPKPEPVPVTKTTPNAEAIKNALSEFKSLSRKERNLRLKKAKAMFKQYKAAKKADANSPDANNVLYAILAVLLPPLAVYLKQNAVDSKFIIDLILALLALIALAAPFVGVLFWIAAIVYALIVVLVK